MAAAEWWRDGPFAAGLGEEAGLRRDAGRILRAAVVAADPESAVRQALTRRADRILSARRVCIVALGKAADAMTRGALSALTALERPPAAGVIVGPVAREEPAPGLVRLCGDHPLPGPSSLSAGEAVRSLAKTLEAGDLVVCLISGGASALAVLPVAGVTLADLAGITESLLRAGADIGEVNTVRRRLDALKGGRLAALLAPADITGLIVSDVPGDRLADIASGPLVPDPTDAEAARSVLVRRGLADTVTPGTWRALEDPSRKAAGLPAVDLEIVASAGLALAGAVAEARSLGYAVDAEAAHVSGEARALGAALAGAIGEGTGRRAILRAGETTVTVRGTGRGGRNQEVALGAVATLDARPDALVAGMGTDGIDGPTDAAGAVATSTTAARAAAAGLDPAAALADNDALRFFEPLGDLIRSGPTGTNVMDVYIALAD